MDAFIYACIAMMVGPVVVYCLLYLRVLIDPRFVVPDAALQGLLGAIPVASIVILLRKGKNGE